MNDFDEVQVSSEEIDDVLIKCTQQRARGGSKWPGMTYEDGVRATIDWIFGIEDESPMAEWV